MSKIWIEAPNGPGAGDATAIPVTVDEIVADGLPQRAGSDHSRAPTIRLPDVGRSMGNLRRIIEGIRAKADVIVYPTSALAPIVRRQRQRRFRIRRS
jgi:hypothetical protein